MKASSTQKKLSDAVDKVLLELISKGRPIYCETTGKVIGHSKPSAADINAAINRLKQCGVSAIPTEENDLGKLVHSLRLSGDGKLPPIDNEADDFATRAA